MNIYDLPTPALLIDYQQLIKNIQDMSDFCREHSLELRPHIKAHKIVEIAKEQIKRGALGITVAKLGEAEVMADYVDDILIAYPLVGEDKLLRMKNLLDKCKVTLTIDNLEQAAQLNNFLRKTGQKTAVLVEIDTGLKRCGLHPQADIVEFVQQLSELSNLIFKGIMTHAGHVYGALDHEQVLQIGKAEALIMLEVKAKLEEAGIKCPCVSVGSTPTAKISGTFEGITETRPGNYVFYDGMQVGLGIVDRSKCALTVLATVVSAPEEGRVIIDAGSKTLALDKGAHGTSLLPGFGLIEGYEHWQINRLSEEHGILELSSSEGEKLKLGQKIRIIPNHACPVLNLSDQAYVVEGEKVRAVWPIAARGKAI